MLKIDWENRNEHAVSFCKDFIDAEPAQRFVFGVNEYAARISGSIEIAAFVDDFCSQQTFQGRPIIKSESIPSNGLVVSSLLGRPLTASKRLAELALRQLDFFSFYNYSGLIKESVRFWGDGKADIDKHVSEYAAIYERLADDESRDLFARLVNFRVTADIAYLQGFSDKQKEQYFEPFLGLKPDDETFVDVGGFHGETSLEFIRRCPEYKSIYFIEPELKNMALAKAQLEKYRDIVYLQKGVSNEQGTANFSASGSVSSIAEHGDQIIEIDTLDNLVKAKVSFIKMDIEGLEVSAIKGAIRTIRESHPLLAICVYHRASDLRTIPAQVLEIRDDYDLYLRHYTEGVVETVMFFVPKDRTC